MFWPAQRVKKYAPTSVVMCSAMGQETMVIDAIRSGAKDFIVKPFKPERVLNQRWQEHQNGGQEQNFQRLNAFAVYIDQRIGRHPSSPRSIHREDGYLHRWRTLMENWPQILSVLGLLAVVLLVLVGP